MSNIDKLSIIINERKNSKQIVDTLRLLIEVMIQEQDNTLQESELFISDILTGFDITGKS